MKRLSRERRDYFKRRSSRIAKGIIKVRARRLRRKSPGNQSPVAILAPESFSLFEAGQVLIRFINDIKKQTLKGRRNLILDLSKTVKLHAEATIYFYAEIDRLIDCFPKIRIRFIPPLHSVTREVLVQIGFYSLLKMDHVIDCNSADAVHWRKARGQGAQGEKYDDVVGHYDGVFAESITSDLYIGTTEAMTNAHHHAYLDIRGDGIRTPKEYRPWWMFTQEKDGFLSVVFCDLGIGIPQSLPRSPDEGWRKWWSTMVRLGLNINDDGLLIEGAIRHSRTRTKMEHRGKGLRQIIETVSAVTNGRANILSNHGWFTSTDGSEYSGNFRFSIQGTIICWKVPLPNER